MAHGESRLSGALSEQRLDRIKAVYAEVRLSLGLQWCGELVELLGPFDRYLQAAWSQFRPNAVSTYFHRVALDVKARSRTVVLESGLPFTDHRATVSASSGADAAAALARTLAAVEAVQAPSLLLATACRDALLGRDVGSCPPRTGPDAIFEERAGAAFEQPLREPVGGGGVEAGARSYQYFADQPAYLEVARRELRHLIKAEQYRRGVVELDAYATAVVRALPFPFRAGGELARAMGYPPAVIAHLLDIVCEQQTRSSELCLQFAALRFAWEGGNLTEG